MPLQDDTWSLFRALPTPGYVIYPDAPDFNILEINDSLLCTVVSDKLHDPLSMDLIGMRERASLTGDYLTITSLPDTKTTVQLLANINNA